MNAGSQAVFTTTLFNDNPAFLELLGFDAVAEAVAAVVTTGAAAFSARTTTLAKISSR